jgi:DNA-binding NarL/FixJ family response regulator
MKKISVLLIEDYNRIDSSIKKILKQNKDIELLAASENSKNKNIDREQVEPDIIMIDDNKKYPDCISIVESSKKEYPASKVIVVNLPPHKFDILQYVRAGAEGFTLLDTTPTELINIIRMADEGLSVLPPPLVNILFSEIVENAAESKLKLNPIELMTKREREVIELLAEGLKNKEIGEKINLSTYTVKSHIHNIMEKLGLHTRLEIANYLYTDQNLRTDLKTTSMVIN